ncbi:MAG: hypothetical protein Q9159_000106 [Coniocarpon cinnabarinum]
MLESFIPGFGIISQLLKSSLGIDVTAIVTVLFVLAAATGALKYAGRAIYRFFIRGRGSEAPNFYFAEIESNTPPDFTPAYGWHRLWYQGTPILLSREKDKDKLLDMTGWDAKQDEKETIYLKCFGWSAAPLKRLLMTCKRFDADLHRSTTTVRRSAQGQQSHWVRAITRPSRSVDTVFMDEKVKTDLMEDLREYLDPNTPIFYARRGIPYRRGYLFHGPPGTGKTSLSFALAGTFGFELYTVSLKEPFMSGHKLTQLFSALPSRCIVLVEDVDAAGLQKRDDTRQVKDGKDKDGGKDKDDKPKESGVVRIRNDTRQYGNASVTYATAEGITLSGLLNAIDGVASQEGRILVMTSNDPESLDSALIRPGRVDKQVYFGYATRYHTRQLFNQMFVGDETHDSTNNTAAFDDEKRSETSHDRSRHTATEIDLMATKFAELLPEAMFSPAEIQGFLLMRRKSPQKALDDAPRWRDALMAARKAGRNILQEHGDGDVDGDASNDSKKPTVNGVVN